MSRRRAIFLDRDGVINANRPDHVKSWDEFVFLPRALDALRLLAGSEFVIVAVLGAGLLLLRRNRASFAPRVYGTVAASILLAVACEFSFTLYFDVFGLWNLLGHFFKIASFVAVYLALVHTGIVDPYRTVFRELTEANRRLTEEVEAHTRTGEAKDAAIAKLTAANEEINVLRGIIPLCAHCGKIRDDRGAWSRIEAYLREHSGTRFSHGICPDCLRKNYPTGGREPV